ncbi:MAG: right-handed parallel beta-helix repeat-containing protein [Pyrinomonadaceae bacterium]
MNKKILSVRIFTTFAFLVACATFASAQATRTWISGVGDDANPCSRTAPCKTLQGTISKTATNGEMNILDPGGFGGVTINKSMTIDGGSFIAGVLVSGSNGIIINAANSVVTLRGLDINGLTTGLSGIRIINAKAVFIENCTIYGFQKGIADERTTGGSLSVTNTVIKNNNVVNALIGGGSTPAIKAVFDNVQLKNSSTGIGLWASTGSTVSVINSVISGNFDKGVYAEETAIVDIQGGTISFNDTGIQLESGSPTVRISNVTITMNNVGVDVQGGSLDSYNNNKIAGNTADGAVSRTIGFH